MNDKCRICNVESSDIIPCMKASLRKIFSIVYNCYSIEDINKMLSEDDSIVYVTVLLYCVLLVLKHVTIVEK